MIGGRGGRIEDEELALLDEPPMIMSFACSTRYYTWSNHVQTGAESASFHVTYEPHVRPLSKGNLRSASCTTVPAKQFAVYQNQINLRLREKFMICLSVISILSIFILTARKGTTILKRRDSNVCR